MTPRLPPELLAHILDLAQEGQSPQQRQTTRNLFRSVCRDWCLAFDPWTEVSVGAADQIERVTKVLSGGAGDSGAAVGERVRLVHLCLPAQRGKQTGAKTATKLLKILGSITNVRKVEFEVGRHGILRGEVLGKAVCKALARLHNIQHFALTHPSHGRQLTKSLSGDQLKLLVSSWPALESITLNASWFSRNVTPANNLFATSSNLRHVDLEQYALLSSLPASVRTLRIAGYYLKQLDADPADADTASQLCNHLSACAPNLLHLALKGHMAGRLDPAARGYHARLIGSLRDVRSLVMPAFAVADLGAALLPLARLEVLELTGAGDYDSARALRPEEVVGYVSRTRALKRLTVAEAIVDFWPQKGRVAVLKAAGSNGVSVIGTGGWWGSEDDEWTADDEDD